MKTYISPNTEYNMMRLEDTILQMAQESGEGSKTNPPSQIVNPGQGLAPGRLYI